MNKRAPNHLAQAAVLAIAEIKAAADAFDRGDANVHDPLDSILAAVGAYRDAARPEKNAIVPAGYAQPGPRLFNGGPCPLPSEPR